MFLRYFESVDSAVKSCLRHVVLLNALLLAEHFLGTLASLLGALYVDLLGKFVSARMIELSGITCIKPSEIAA